MAVKLIAFDLDGTFFNTKKEVPAENMKALVEAQQRGILTVPASGRLFPGIPGELKTDGFRYLILGNGLQIYDSLTDTRLCNYEIPLDKALKFFDYAEENGLHYDCYAGDLAWMDRGFYDRIPEIFQDESLNRIIRTLRTPVPDLRQHIISNYGSVQKICIYYTDPALRLQHLKELPQLMPEYNFTSALFCNIEVNDAKADKGQALKALCGILGIAEDETMAIGDGLNDAGMFDTAGVSVAMGNSLDSVAKRARYVTGNCDAGGFADAVRKYALA